MTWEQGSGSSKRKKKEPEIGILKESQSKRSIFSKKQKEVKLLLLGLDNSGKTTLIKKLSAEDITNVFPTYGFNQRNLRQGTRNLTMMDVGGQKSLRPFWHMYLEGIQGVIFMIDSSDRRRITEAGMELQKILEVSISWGPTIGAGGHFDGSAIADCGQQAGHGPGLFCGRNKGPF